MEHGARVAAHGAGEAAVTPELWQRLKPLYNAALDVPEESRSGLLDEICAGDQELAQELRALLHSDRNAGQTLDSPFDALSFLLPSRPPVLAEGTLLGHRFRILRHLGSGGMGDVYEASDEAMEQGRIALKTIRPAIARNPAALARFKDEVRLARKVSGPNVCRIHELYLPTEGDGPAGTAFLTMELLEGSTLHDRITEKGALPLEEAKAIAAQLCIALRCIHEAGIVHQDLKPRNVMLVPGEGEGAERVVVMDFGLARAAVRASAAANGNGSGSHAPLVAGTPSYMAPEQFEGGEVGPPTDIYALGLILYEMVTGVQPYAAHTPLAAAIRRSRPPTHASSVRKGLPPLWDEVIGCCLQVDPAQRYASAEEVSRALTHPSHIFLRLGPHQRLSIHRSVALACAALLLLSVCAGVWWSFFRPRHRELAPDAAHWYAMGMEALREGSYLKATRLLTMVTQRDPTYALAHAALADAWTELDFTSTAQHEMLLASAPQEEAHLSDLDRRYVDAVRTTLVRDYSAAAQDYEAILNKLPAERKAQGYVDLGRIYEKAGKVSETVQVYEKAAKLNPDDPAPFLHLGILKSRLRDVAGADAAFSSAERLYGAESNLEGLAEVAYQRGYAANDAAQTAQANDYLQKSLAIAREIPSVQLQVRSLSQLSSVAYNDSKDDRAIALANEAMQLARDNGLEYWVTDCLIRLGNTYLDKGDYASADAVLTDASRRAQENSHPRLEATASLTLASLRFQQQRWEEEIDFARRALKYFQDYGFIGSADKALILEARGHRSRGDYTAALATGQKLLAQAERAHSVAYSMLAEELVGGILFRLQRYPEALPHYTHALELANELKQNQMQMQLSRADLLWQLGRYTEAQAQLAAVPEDARKRPDTGPWLYAIEARMKLSEGDPRAALLTAEKAWNAFPKLRAGTDANNQFLLRTAALSEAELQHGERARQFAGELARLDQNKVEAWQAAQTQLTQAVLAIRLNDPATAAAHARSAETFFAQKSIAESDALSLLTAAEAAQAVGDGRSGDELSRKAVDILRSMAQSWGIPVFRQYLSRPDRQETIRALTRLREAHGDTLNALFQ